MREFCVSRVRMRGRVGRHEGCQSIWMSSRSVLRAGLAFAMLFTVASGASALEPPKVSGYGSSLAAINAGGGFDYTREGDLLSVSVDYVNGPAVMLTDMSGDNKPAKPVKLAQFTTSVYASFLKVEPKGKFALFGMSNSFGAPASESKIYRVDLKSNKVTEVATVIGNYDLAFLDRSRVYISANPGGFDSSQPNVIYLMDLAKPQDIKKVVEIGDTPSGPIAVSKSGDLYYVRGTWTFPVSPKSFRLLKFASADLLNAFNNDVPLDAADSQISVALDGGYGLALLQSVDAKGGDELYVSALEAGIFKVDTKSLTPVLFAEAKLENGDGVSYSIVKVSQTHGEFSPCASNRYQKGKLLLGVAMAANFYSDNYLVNFDVAGDDDKNGVSDCREGIGSLYTSWNSFNRMTNILELNNHSERKGSVRVKFFDSKGKQVKAKTVALQGYQHYELDLGREGVSASASADGSLGTVQVILPEWMKISGGMTFYQGDLGIQELGYAYHLPLVRGSIGERVGGFNTVSPASVSGEPISEAPTENWLSITNVDAQQAVYVVNRYDMSGGVIDSRTVKLPSLARVDVPIHKGLATQVGAVAVKPTNHRSPYLAHLTRFGKGKSDGRELSGDMSGSIALSEGSERVQTAAIANREGGDNWLELLNVGVVKGSVRVKCYSAPGKMVYDKTYRLAPYAQQHLAVSGLVPAGQVGQCRILPERNVMVVGQSVTYHRSSDSVSLSMTPLSDGYGKRLQSGYNLFLGQDNRLQVFNPTNKKVQIAVMLVDSSTPTTSGKLSGKEWLSRRTAEIAPFGVAVFNLEKSTVYNTSSNTFGSVIVESTGKAKSNANGQGVVAQIVRTRMNAEGNSVDYEFSDELE